MMNWINLKTSLIIFISIRSSAEVISIFSNLPRFPDTLESKYFADNLFREKDYINALIEYERLNFFSPTPYFKYKIGMCYWKLKELEKADSIFSELNTPYELVQVQLELGKYSLARFTCEEWDKNLVGYIYMIEGKWDEAVEVIEDKRLREYAIAGKRLPYKSERLACMLSILLPGLGELYANKWIDGSITFLLNLLCVMYTIHSYRNRNYFTATLVTSSLWSRFYTGGVSNAERAVQEYNRTLKERYLTKVANEYSSSK